MSYTPTEQELEDYKFGRLNESETEKIDMWLNSNQEYLEELEIDYNLIQGFREFFKHKYKDQVE